MSTLIITMDPGAHKVGLAAGWLEDGKPFFVTTLDVKTNLKGYARAVFVAKAAETEVLLAVSDNWRRSEHGRNKALVVVEAMQADSRTDSNKVKDILDCQATGAAFVAFMSAYASVSLPTKSFREDYLSSTKSDPLSPTPSEWIKGMPKDVMRRQLMEQWPDVVTAKTGHDAVSAAGLFRWALPFARFS